jgi:hypothetical protein
MDKLSTSFLIGAQIRRAAQQGVPIVVRRKGDETQGAIILKINRLDGTAHVLTQARMDEEVVWNPVSKTDPASPFGLRRTSDDEPQEKCMLSPPLPEADAERYLERQIAIDPDIWIIEIEDREGRVWFPGRVVRV